MWNNCLLNNLTCCIENSVSLSYPLSPCLSSPLQGIMLHFPVLSSKPLTASVSSTTQFTRGALRSFRDARMKNTVSNPTDSCSLSASCCVKLTRLQLIISGIWFQTSSEQGFTEVKSGHNTFLQNRKIVLFILLVMQIQSYSSKKSP